MPVEVNKDRNGRMIYIPLKPTNKPEISFGAEIRTPRTSDNEDQEDEVTEVEYPRSKRTESNIQNQDVRANVDINIINQTGHVRRDKACEMLKSVLTKRELISLIRDEIKLDEKQSINLVEIINNAALSEQNINHQCD